MCPKLTADDLGNVGEARFGLLCGEAQLICNKSQRDLTGWDFMVQFPMPAGDSAGTLDQRQTTSCLVQLKSTADVDRGRVSLRLSSIEQLAKDPRPAAVVVFQLKPDGEGINGYLIHLLDEQLARVLKRLRLAHAAETLDVNHTTISFDYRKVGTSFELTAEAYIGPSPVLVEKAKLSTSLKNSVNLRNWAMRTVGWSSKLESG